MCVSDFINLGGYIEKESLVTAKKRMIILIMDSSFRKLVETCDTERGAL